MYEERRESFSVRDLILQVLFIVLFVFILIWLFPTKDYMKKYIKDNNKGNSTQIIQSDFDVDQLAVLYNQIFANNVVAMKEAAVGYYTTDRLPAKVGQSDKMTLQQMYDKHLVLKLTDKNGNACDVNKSYVSVTKYENEYQMKVNLSCGSEEDYIIVYLGCYDYCDATGVCEKQTPAKPTTPSKPAPSKPNNTTVNKVTNITNNYYYNNWQEWLKENSHYFDYIYLQRPHIAVKYIDLVKQYSHAKILYFAHDLHHIREYREYEMTKDPKKLESSQNWKKIEYDLFSKTDVGHVVGSYEQEIMQKAFPNKPIRNIPLYIYDKILDDINKRFKERHDLLYVGGFGHPPNIDAVLWFA